MSALPKVLVGTPICDWYEYCWDEFYEAVNRMDYPNYDLLFVDNSKDDSFYKQLLLKGVPVVRAGFEHERARDRMIHGRNLLRHKALTEGYDYFCNIEQDVIPPKNFLKKMVMHQKKVITGIYYSRYKIHGQPTYLPVLWKDDGEDSMKFFTIDEVEGDELIRVRSCGMGCLFIHRDVLQDIEFWYDRDKDGFDDVCFCITLWEKGIPLYADTGLKCKHMIEGRSWKGKVK
tara:strand:- start:507 stop:1199 length:693 start_codon:yes stop_codon:yes gene_type:complete